MTVFAVAMLPTPMVALYTLTAKPFTLLAKPRPVGPDAHPLSL